MKNQSKEKYLFHFLLILISLFGSNIAFAENSQSARFMDVVNSEIQSYFQEKALKSAFLFTEPNSHTYFLFVKPLSKEPSYETPFPTLRPLADKLFFSVDGKQFFETPRNQKFFQSAKNPVLDWGGVDEFSDNVKVKCAQKKINFVKVHLIRKDPLSNQISFQPLDQATIHLLPKPNQIPAQFPDPCKVLAPFLK